MLESNAYFIHEFLQFLKNILNQTTLSVYTTSVSLERIVLLTQEHTYMNIAEMANGCSECSFEIRVGNCPFRVWERVSVSVCVCWGFSEIQCLILICTLLLLCLLSDLHISSVFVYILFCHQFLPPQKIYFQRR